MSLLDDLERLAQLRERGMLTDEEFQAEKQKLLEASSLNNAPPGKPVPPSSPPWQDPTPTLPPPPPLSEPDPAPYTPPVTEPEAKGNQEPIARKVVKEKNKGYIRRIIAAALAVISTIILIEIALTFISSDVARDTLRDAVIMRPEPVLVTHECDDEEASLFEYRVTVRGIVRNIGADGHISANVVVIQDGREFTRRDHRYMRKDEEWRIEKTFDEPEAADGKVGCRIDVRAEN